jgi:hypothetical protein
MVSVGEPTRFIRDFELSMFAIAQILISQPDPFLRQMMSVDLTDVFNKGFFC